MTNPKIWLSSPHMGTEEQKFVAEAFDTNWIAPLGPHVNNFEKDLQSFTGAKHAAALTSGTGALHLALILLGVKAGDEVIMPTFTIISCAQSLVNHGVTPVLIDSDYKTFNVNVEEIESKITSNT